MVKTKFTLLFIFLASFPVYAQWRPAGDKIKTRWASQIDVKNVLPEYPRPIMKRSEWQNLNGLWNYAILPAGKQMPSSFDGKILVPFAVESSLSGVQKMVGKDNELWYQREFTIPSEWEHNKILLHFGAVDWKADVWINDIKIGSHKGGYTPFYFEITPFLTNNKTQKLTVRVWDPSDEGFQPRGKQVNNPKGARYTTVTGIWQTVWIEPVPPTYIKHLITIPNIDGNNVTVKTCTEGMLPSDLIEVKVLDNGKTIGSGEAATGQEVTISMTNVKLWSPESPFLYDMEVSILRKGSAIDKVSSYFGMRKISTCRDVNGIVRLQLNNKNCFQLGTLDQGYWPDGLYTAPTDEALLYDIKKTKELGFNTIRKHVKVEPARWYYHCDKEGILVWQDMPSGEKFTYKANEYQQFKYYDGKENIRPVKEEENFRREWKEIIDLCFSNPSVVVWILFNEGWGQFKTPELTEWTKNYDPSRLVNPASGGNHYEVGDMVDMHNYPDPVVGVFDRNRANVLGEYGGIGLSIEGHLWEKENSWGYNSLKHNSEDATNTYIDLAEKLKDLIPYYYSAAIYTQITDVESEVNGLMTYDREIVKMDEDKIKKINQEICTFPLKSK